MTRGGGHNGRGLPECVTLPSSSSLGTDRLLQSADSPLGAIYQAATLQVPLWNTPESTAIQERPEHQWSSRKDFFLCGTGRDRGNFFFFFFWLIIQLQLLQTEQRKPGNTENSGGKKLKGKKKKDHLLQKAADKREAWKETGLCYSYCWIHVLLLKTSTSVPHYGNSWPPVCSSRASVGISYRESICQSLLITELPSWALAPLYW